jgi:vitamin B12 transporter
MSRLPECARRGWRAPRRPAAVFLFLSLSASTPALGAQALPPISIGGERATRVETPSQGDSGETSDIVVTPDRVEEPKGRSAAAVSVIPAAQVERRGGHGLTEVLRGAPGLDIYETGGPGTQTSLSLRGASPGQTLVMIDGIRIGDPSSTDGSVDLGAFAATDIERIEVLRGPQSALYGSDAMGGVVNIITRKGDGKPRRSLLLEGGAYGTGHMRAALSGSEDRFSYAVSFDALHREGFPRYGYRVNRPLTLGDGVTPLPPLPPNDPTNRMGASARLSLRLTDALSVEGGFAGDDNAIRFDNPYVFGGANIAPALVPLDVYNPATHSHATFGQGYLRADAELLDRTLHNRLTLYSNVTNRDNWITESCYDANFNAYTCRFGFRGRRRGLEYQADLKLGAFGLATFGAADWTETAHLSQGPVPLDPTTPVDFAQTTRSGFAQHQFTLFDRVDVTYGGRIDAIGGGPLFKTWRATAAYRIDETQTKIRGSAGTGAKIASLYQRFSQYGDRTLQPERSEGYDVGVDQKFLGGRLAGSISVFTNRYKNLIEFGSAPSCSATQAFGCYYNVGRAETKGVEASGEAVLLPDMLRLQMSYTYLVAKNLAPTLQENERTLLRRPYSKGAASLIFTGVPGLELEARVTAAGRNPDYDFINRRRETLAPYARVDFFANYRLDENLSVFGRAENVGDARYEEVLNYGTAGRSLYGGVKFTW